DHVLNAYEESMAGEPVSRVHAVDALIGAAQKYGADLEVLCTGALTNLAMAIEKDAGAMQSVRRTVVMGGAYRYQFREANIAIDPEAAAIVFGAGLRLSAIGYEQASRSSVPLACYGKARFGNPGLAVLMKRLAAGYAHAYQTDRVTLCDVSAAVLSW